MFPKPISWLGMEKTKPNTTKAHIHRSKEMYKNTSYYHHIRLMAFLQHKINTKSKVDTHDIRPGNEEGLFWFQRFIRSSLTHL